MGKAPVGHLGSTARKSPDGSPTASPYHSLGGRFLRPAPAGVASGLGKYVSPLVGDLFAIAPLDASIIGVSRWAWLSTDGKQPGYNDHAECGFCRPRGAGRPQR
jgi:hypothetical protein